MSMSASCAICMSSYDEGADGMNDDVVVIKCGHAFHRSCLMEWKNSSRQMTCPECRTKFTQRTLHRLYLNVLPKDDDKYFENEREAAKLKQDKERLLQERQQVDYQLLSLQNHLQESLKQNQDLKSANRIKSEGYDLMASSNQKYYDSNEILKTENVELKQRIDTLKRELNYFKVQQLKSAKPFVDLTSDSISDDSDIEIVEDCESSRKKMKVSPVAPTKTEIIELDDENSSEKAEKASPANASDKTLYVALSPRPEDNCLKNPFAITNDDEDLPNFEQFQNFILDQIPNY